MSDVVSEGAINISDASHSVRDGNSTHHTVNAVKEW